jgi:phage/plasmid-like protein (TIGR03299 family)
MSMLALAPMDTDELTSLVTTARASAFDILTRDRLSWGVEKRPVYLGNGQVIPGKFATVRTDTERALGIVGNRYNVIQNRTGLDLFDTAAQAGAVEYGRAGTFKGGAVVWLQAALPGSMRIGPDEVSKFLLLANTHDGSGTMRILLTPIRVVCKNTLAMALRSDAGMTIRHTASSGAKMRAAQAAIEAAQRYYAEFADAGAAMFSRKLSYSGTKAAIDAIFPSSALDGETSTRLDNTRGKVIDLVERGKGQYAIRGTAWGVYNAVAEYTDHFRSTRGDEANRLESAWLGSGAAIKRRAFEILSA